MGIELVRPELTELKPRITVIGMGGAGGNAVTNMIQAGLQGVDFVVANTDAQALASNPAETRIQLGLKITEGLGAGSRPEIGRAAAEEALSQIETALDGAHMCFITAGMGGGTGTGAAPVVAKLARERNILTVGVVTKPFSFEGARRMRVAEDGITELQKHVDTLIIIPNQNLFLIASASTTFKEAFTMADQVLHQGVRGITDLMVMPGLINLDFADIRTVMGEMGKAMMGTGEAEGENRAIEAAEKAIANPLLDEVSMKGAKGVIINITGGDDLRLMEVDEAANHIRQLVDEDANIIVGSAFNSELEGRMRVSVVATGIDAKRASEPAPAPVSQLRSTGLGGASSFGSRPFMVGVPQQPASAAPAATPAQPQQLPANEESFTEVASAPPVEDEELRLDVADVVEEQPVAAAAAEPVVTPAATPAPPVQQAEAEPAEREWLAPRQAAAQPEADQRPLTLFERMMSIKRGAAQAEEPAASAAASAPAAPRPAAGSEDPLEIPRFFRRQVND